MRYNYLIMQDLKKGSPIKAIFGSGVGPRYVIDLNPLRAGLVDRPDSGIIGTKEFVSKNYMRFKHHFSSKNEKKPKPVKGLSGVYSLKRLSEVV